MLYLSLPPSDGALARELKEALLAKMFEEKKGLLHATEELNLSPPRVFAELKIDQAFADKVQEARIALAEYWHEEAVAMADRAKGRDDTPAIALQVKTRLTIADQLIPRLRALEEARAKTAAGNHLTIYITEEKAKRLAEQHARIAQTTPAEAPARARIVEQGQAVSTEQEPKPDETSGILERLPMARSPEHGDMVA